MTCASCGEPIEKDWTKCPRCSTDLATASSTEDKQETKVRKVKKETKEKEKETKDVSDEAVPDR